MGFLSSRRFLLVVWLGVWAGQVAAMHVPLRGHGPSSIPHLDKVAHAGIYFVLTLANALRMGVHRRRVATRTLIFWAFGIALYAVVDELTQPWTARDADVKDWIADVIGIAGATCLAGFLRPPADNAGVAASLR